MRRYSPYSPIAFAVVLLSLCNMIAVAVDTMSSTTTDSPLCSGVTVDPVHRVGLGAAGRVTLSLPLAIADEIVVQLDGAACTLVTASTASCPIEEYRGLSLWDLIDTNATVAMQLTVGTASCWLNETNDGTLQRFAHLTPIIHAISPANSLLPYPRVRLVWSASPLWQSVLPLAHETRFTVAEITTAEEVVVPINSSALAPVGPSTVLVSFPRYRDSPLHAAWNVTLKESSSGMVQYAVIRPSHYAMVPQGDALQLSVSIVVPLISNISATTNFVNASRVTLVTVAGAFPACVTQECSNLSIAMTHVTAGWTTPCLVVSRSSVQVTCYMNVSVRDVTPTSFVVSSGFESYDGQRSAWTTHTPPQWSTSAFPNVSAPAWVHGWNAAGNRTRGTIRFPSLVERVRIHCTSVSTMIVKDASGITLCQTGMGGSVVNHSMEITVTDNAALQLDVACSTTPVALTCAVTVEVTRRVSLSPPPNGDLIAVMVIASTSEELTMYVPLVDSTVILSVPVVTSDVMCASITTASLLLASNFNNAIMDRFVEAMFGDWDYDGQRCVWHLVLSVSDCGALVRSNTFPVDVVYCGYRINFLDPVPWSLVGISPMNEPSSSFARAPPDAMIPTLAFGGYPTSTCIRSTDQALVLLSPSSDMNTTASASLCVPKHTTTSNLTVTVRYRCNASNYSVQVALMPPAPVQESWMHLLWPTMQSSTMCYNESTNATCQNVTITAPSTAIGRYRVVVFSPCGTTFAPPWEVPYTSENASEFILLVPTVTSVTTDAVGVGGGAVFTMHGSRFPSSVNPVYALELSIISGDAPTPRVTSSLFLSGPDFVSWLTGDLSNVTGTRVLNTVQARWIFNLQHSTLNETIFVANGSVGVLQAVALPRITSVSPVILSSVSSGQLTIIGTTLNLKTLTLCAERNPNAVSPTTFMNRDMTSCEICVPSVMNATFAICTVPLTFRIGAYALYVSSPVLGGTAYEVPLRSEFLLTSIEPNAISTYGAATMTVIGVALDSSWSILLRSTTTSDVLPCRTLSSSLETSTCYVDPTSEGVALPESMYRVFAYHPESNSTVECTGDDTVCHVNITGDFLPSIVRVVPSRGQAPMAVTVYGTQFTGNLTWVDPNATNLDMYVGNTRCIIELPMYYDRIICNLQHVCSSSSTSGMVWAVVSQQGRTSTSFNINSVFHCIMQVTAIYPTQGSTMGGQIVTISGTGFPSSLVVLVGGIECAVKNSNSTTVLCETQSVGAVVDQDGDVVVTSRDEPSSFAACCEYSYLSSLTPIVDTIAPTTGSEGVRATVIGSKFSTGVQVEMSGVLIADAVVLSPTSVNLLIPRLPPSKSTIIKLSIVGIGNAYHSSTLEPFTYSLTVTRINPARGSFMSGLVLTIVGSGLGINTSTMTSGTSSVIAATTQVFICSKECSLLSLDFSTLTCTIPEYVDATTIASYPNNIAITSLRTITVYRRLLLEDSQRYSWTNVTSVFTGNTAAKLVATNSTEVLLIAAAKHSRIALTKMSLKMLGIRNVSQNVTCTLRRPLATAPITTLSALDASQPDWSSSLFWSTSPSWSATRLVNGWTSNPTTVSLDASRFFLLTCEHLVPGETTIESGSLRGAVVGLTATGGSCPVNIVVSSSQVYESCTDPMGTGCSSFIYDTSQTPVMTSFSLPYSLFSVASRITLSGAGFGLVADSVTNIVIGDSACQVQFAQESSMVCVTQGRLHSAITGGTGLSIIGKGLARVAASSPFFGAEAWSAPNTWYRTTVPSPDSIVHIPPNVSVLLDHVPPRLTAIIIEGTLILADIPLTVQVCTIIILAGGTLQGGNVASPLASAISFTFVDSPYMTQLTLGDTGIPPHKALFVLGGDLRLYGVMDPIMTSLLQQTAEAGSRTVTIQDRVAWPVGSLLQITKTNPSLDETEQRYLVSKTLVGTTAILELDRPLDFSHVYVSDVFLRSTIAVSARVVLLVRNVWLQGNEGSDDTREGLTVLASNNARVTLNAVGIFRCGKVARPGMSTLSPGSAGLELWGLQSQIVAQGLLLRRSYHRGVVLRNTSQVSMISCIVTSTCGHGIAAMDGNNFNLFLSQNVVLSSRVHPTEGSIDLYPSNYYLSHPSVNMSNNFAAGASGDCVWFYFESDDALPNPSCASQQKLLGFSGNVLCGAMRDGVRITPSLTSRDRPCVTDNLGVAGANGFLVNVLTQTLIFGCKGNGIFTGPVGSLSITSTQVLDCGLSCVSLGAGAGTVTIADTLLSATLTNGDTVLGQAVGQRNGLVLRGAFLEAVLSNIWIRNATATSLLACPSIAPQQAPLPTFISSTKITIAGANGSTSAAFCGLVILLDSDGSFTQLQRELYIVANHGGSLNTSGFTMCRTFADATDLSPAVSNGIVDGDTHRNTTLVLCDTYSTYSFMPYMVSVHCSPGLCSNIRMNIYHDSKLIVTIPSVRRSYANIYLGHYNDSWDVTFVVVDGRPTTVTAQASILSSKLQYVIIPECNATTPNCSVGLVAISRWTSMLPTYPAQLLVDPRSSSVYTSLSSVLGYRIAVSGERLTTQWIPNGVTLTGLQDASSTDTIETALVAANVTLPLNASVVSPWILTATFSTSTSIEGVLIQPMTCTPIANTTCCLPPVFPINAAPTIRNLSWSDPAAWFGGNVPNASTSVAVIPQGTTVTLDSATVATLQALIVVGTLIINPDRSNVTIHLRFTHLIVFGSIIITASNPSSACTIRMLTLNDANDTTIGMDDHAMCRPGNPSELEIGPNMTVPCGTILVAGVLRATGARRATWWSNGAAVAAGTHAVGAPVDYSLQTGWRIGLTSTDPIKARGEVNILTTNVSAGEWVSDATLNPWEDDHRATVLPSGATRFGEAVNFNKSIVFKCALRTTSFGSGCTFTVALPTFPKSISTVSNQLFLSGVKIEGFGYRTKNHSRPAAWHTSLSAVTEPGNPALYCSSTASAVVINDTVIANSFHIGLLVASVNTTTVSNVAVWNTNASGVILAGSRASVSRLLVAGASFAYEDDGVIVTDATVPLCGVLDATGNNTIVSSVCGGSASEGFCFPWSGCSLPLYQSITAYSCAVGVFLFDPIDLVLGNRASQADASIACTDGRLTVEVFRNSFIGVQSSQHTSLTINVVSAKNPIGVYLVGRIDSSGITRIMGSFSGFSGCRVSCSFNYARSDDVDCYNVLFTGIYGAVGILIPPVSLGSIPLTYNRSGFPFVGIVIPDALAESRNLSITPSLVISSVSFSNFGSCGYAMSIHPLALAFDFPPVTTSGIYYDVTPLQLYSPGHTVALPGHQNGGPCTSSTGLCYNTHTMVINDIDGTLRNANATATVVAYQFALETLSCSGALSGLMVCPTTLPLGRLTLALLDRSPQFAMDCVSITVSYGTLTPQWGSCMTALQDDVPDATLSLLVVAGSSHLLKSSVIPRQLALTVDQCTGSVLIQIQLLEVFRTSVWVGNSSRTMGTGIPAFSRRTGEWYRNPLLVSDDVVGDEADWVAVLIQCGTTVVVNQVAFGSVTLVVNTSVALMSNGYNERLAALLASITNRPPTSVFVAMVVPSLPTTQSEVTVYFEADDSPGSNSTQEALTINAALASLVGLGSTSLSAALSLVVFRITTTPVPLSIEPRELSQSAITFTDVITFGAALGSVLGLGMLVYWYLMMLRVSMLRAAKKAGSEIQFGDCVDVLPSTDDDGFAIEETVPETSREARLNQYLDDWRIIVAKPLPTSLPSSAEIGPLIPTHGSPHVSETNPSAAHQPMVTSVIAGFLQSNQDNRMRSPGRSPLSSSVQQPSSLPVFLLEPMTPPPTVDFVPAATPAFRVSPPTPALPFEGKRHLLEFTVSASNMSDAPTSPSSQQNGFERPTANHQEEERDTSSSLEPRTRTPSGEHPTHMPPSPFADTQRRRKSSFNFCVPAEPPITTDLKDIQSAPAPVPQKPIVKAPKRSRFTYTKSAE